MKSILTLSGIGEKRGEDFAKRGIETIEDLLFYFPRNYEDRTKFTEISDSIPGENVCIKAKVFAPVKETRIRKNFTIYSMVVFDDSGAITVVWYNNRFVKNAFKSGDELVFYGKVSASGRKKELQNPVYEKADKQRFIGKIVPIYPLSGALTQNVVRSAIENALEAAGRLEEYLPWQLRQKYNIAEINYAMQNIHFPKDFESYEIARRRFIFEELLLVQLALTNRRAENTGVKRKPFEDTDCSEFISSLRFELTGAQKRVIEKIGGDFRSGLQMNRLIQGDVGSGKTVVAAAAMYTAFKNGCQSAIMAPTEILASQHYETFLEFFKDTPIKITLLTSGTKNKKTLHQDIKAGNYDIVIGTNAIIRKDVEYKNLGLVVTDEQHRFGVSQRAELVKKGENPHTLIMTATPIPRTLSLILYGDLDISVIDELPPGRKPVMTYAVGENMRKRIYAFLDKHIKNGSQAYVVCPLIEESEKSDLADAKNIHERLKSIFPDYNVGLIHGKMKASEKETVMKEFVENKIRILVSTTVIEVGVNVPGSNIMVIENAERFGLSTLHQLRGRVGRGGEQAYCIMFVHSDSDITKQRMKTLCESNDGFYISEQDLKLRGPGDFFGTRQHGLPEFKIANLFTDCAVLEQARAAASEIAENKIEITEPERMKLNAKMRKILYNNVVLN